mgnify:CR=1 FL=1
MKINLISLEIKNFKGIKEQLVNFADVTQIQGGNGTGKTTVFDTFCWLMFGKDSHDKKTFEIQTLDESNKIIHHLEHSVTGILEIDGVQKTFKRTLKEKWQKKRGSAEQELNGCSTDYEIDEIPVKQKEYLEKINEILEESSFKLLTNPLYFPNMEWKKQREILLDIIGDLDEKSVINYNSKLKPLMTLLEGTNIDDFNKRTAASIKKLKDKVKDIPARIDENNNSICTEDFTELEKQKATLQNDINVIDEQIADTSKANEGKLVLQEELFTLKDKLSVLRNEALRNANKPLKELEDKINVVKSEIQEINFKIKSAEHKRDRVSGANLETEKEIKKLVGKREEMLKEYHKVDGEVFIFNESETVCKCCARPFDMDKIEEIKETARIKFEENKKHNLDAIIKGGSHFKPSIAKYETMLCTNKEDVEKLTNEVIYLESKEFELNQNLEELESQKQKLDCAEPIIEGEKELLSKIETIQGRISNFKSNDNSLLLSEKRTLQEQLSNTDRILGKQQTNAALKIRMSELSQEEKDLNIQIAALEGQQFLGEEFIRTKVELLESTINKKFKGEVSFKLFNNLINGGLEETCQALINGVPFSDANTASKMNAGISILNTLCDYYKTNAPVFIDNSESINEIKDTNSQLILLKVTLSDKLIIKNGLDRNLKIA